MLSKVETKNFEGKGRRIVKSNHPDGDSWTMGQQGAGGFSLLFVIHCVSVYFVSRHFVIRTVYSAAPPTAVLSERTESACYTDCLGPMTVCLSRRRTTSVQRSTIQTSVVRCSRKDRVFRLSTLPRIVAITVVQVPTGKVDIHPQHVLHRAAHASRRCQPLFILTRRGVYSGSLTVLP